MIHLRDLNISVKLTFISVASAAAALLCVVAAFVVQDLRLVKRVKAEQVETHLSILAGNLAHAMVLSDSNTIEYLLQNSISAHGVTAIAVYDRRGALLAQYPPATTELNAYEAGEESHSRAIVWRGGSVGHMEVWVSQADVAMRATYMAIYSALAFLFAIVIAGGVAWLVQKIVSQPLLKLYQLSRDVMRTGNYSLRADLQGRDELGQLGEAFNRMLSQIEQRDTMMERQVAQRTQELQKLAEEFRYQALHDTLTGLPNRALLNEEFTRAVAHARRSGKQFALMLLDLDNFKVVNDSHGHEVGDALLKNVASHIASTLRAGDMICRVGGDEFILLLEGVESTHHIEAVGRNLLRTLQENIRVAGYDLSVGVSIGVSFFPQHGEDLSSLKHNADIAMYCAKSSGKNCLVVYENALQMSGTAVAEDIHCV